MKVIFAHDHRFIALNGKVFSESQFDSSLWTRYLIHFEEVIVVAREGSLPNYKKPEDIIISSRKNVNFKFIPNLSNPVNQLRKRPEAVHLMNQCVQNADAVIARLPSEIGLLAIQCGVMHNKPWAVEIAGCPWDGLWNYGNWQGKIYAPIMTYRLKRTVYKAPFALYVTDQFLQRRYPCHIGQSINCSDVEIPLPSKTILNQRLDRIRSSKPCVVLGLIGTLKGKFKGIQTLLATLSQVRKQLPPVELRILGGGDPRYWIDIAKQYNVDDITHFDGTLPGGEAVFKWLDNIDIYLQPSFKEGLPRALIEAMSRGCPAIASNVAGIPELLEAENLISPGDVEHLGQLLLQVTSNQDWQVQQSERNWLKSCEYTTDILDSRRNEFWGRFSEYAASFYS